MGKRLLQINSEIQKALSEIISMELQNPKITGIISVIKVDATSDLDQCKVYLSIFTTDDKQEVFNQIRHSASFIRRELARRIDLKKVPFLTFILDETIENNFKIESLIAESKVDTKDDVND